MSLTTTLALLGRFLFPWARHRLLTRGYLTVAASAAVDLYSVPIVFACIQTAVTWVIKGTVLQKSRQWVWEVNHGDHREHRRREEVYVTWSPFQRVLEDQFVSFQQPSGISGPSQVSNLVGMSFSSNFWPMMPQIEAKKSESLRIYG